MSRSTLLSVGLVLLSSAGSAQTPASSRLVPVTSEVRHGGTYHVSTRTWTRNPVATTANLGPDTLYDNTCSVDFYYPLSSGLTVVDAGRVPSTSSPMSSTSVTGTADSYVINGLQYAYCTHEGPTVDIEVSHIECYSPCASAFGLPAVSALAITGAPGSAIVGSQSCWIIDVDLQDASFTLMADCNGAFSNSPPADNFGWTMRFTTDPANGPQGPLLAGDPYGYPGGPTRDGCPYGDGTVWVPGTTTGTGIGSNNLFTEYDPAGTSSCWFFAVYGYASFWHRLFGDATPPTPEPGTPYCDGGGATASCPCGNENDGSAGGPAGCANTNNPTGGVLRASGVPFAPPPDQLVLEASNVQPLAPGLFFQGDDQVFGGAGQGFGDGLRCVGSNVVRLQVVVADVDGDAVTTVDLAAAGGVSPGQTKYYQYWYRNPAVSPCGMLFNLTNGYRIP